MHRMILIIILISGGLFFFTGCSASSYGMRYNTTEAKPKKAKTTIVDTTQTMSDAYLENDVDPEDEVEPVSTKKYDFFTTFNEAANKSTTGLDANFTDAVDEMKMAIVKYDQTPYQYGGNGLDGIDCSGFTLNVYSQAFSMKLPRSAREQFQVGEVISNRDELKFGDLVFFNTRRRVRPGHVGIYIGDNKFVHASSSSGVTISSLDEDYYNRKYMGGRRVLQIDSLREANK